MDLTDCLNSRRLNDEPAGTSRESVFSSSFHSNASDECHNWHGKEDSDGEDSLRGGRPRKAREQGTDVREFDYLLAVEGWITQYFSWRGM